MLTEKQILDIVRNMTLESFDNDIKNISINSSVLYYPLLISRLNKYQKVLSIKSNIPLKEEIDHLQYDLYNVIREILMLKYSTKYRICLYIINAFFNKYQDDAFSHTMISRYNILKYENEKHQKTFYNLTYLFSIFCKEENKSSLVISALFPKLLDRNNIYFTDKATDNLYMFYKER